MKSVDSINLQYTTIKDPLPDFIYKGLRQYSKNANVYQPQPKELVVRLVKKHGVSEEMIYLTAGADEGIQMFALAFGENAFVFTPTYVVYSDVEEFGGKLTRLYSLEKGEFRISTERIKGASLIYLANPNNPAGFTSKDKVVELIENNREAVVVVDEAYGEFANLSVIDRVRRYKNLAVLRSFSKGYGMAGNRIGYIVANNALILKVKDKTQWSNISYLSVGAAMIALDHEKYFKKMRKGIQERREDFFKFLAVKGFEVINSKINCVFIHFKNKGEADKFENLFNSANIVVSRGNGSSNIGLDDTFVRIAIGNKEQMEVVKKVIERR